VLESGAFHKRGRAAATRDYKITLTWNRLKQEKCVPQRRKEKACHPAARLSRIASRATL
jgi:hypothetical protein